MSTKIDPSADVPNHPMRVPYVGRGLGGWQAFRRWMSRSEWGRRILKAPYDSGDDGDGLVLVQIDGLSRTQLERAISTGKMPFLKKLLEREKYELHTHYSGLPSTTSAVQAELFFGAPSAVPAHSYRASDRGEVVTMLDSEKAQQVERRISQQGEGVLRGGSAYCNIYTGGATEPHFCASAMGFGDLFRGVNPLRSLVFALMNIGSFIRAFAAGIVEVAVAIADCFRGSFSLKEIYEDAKFIPSRVIVGVVLRELMTAGADVDIARGLPIVQLNFLGYDEHAHRRGPDSQFALWSLRGVDRCIQRLWRTAMQSRRRSYHVWVYSDHGQERVTPYDKLTGRFINESVLEILKPFYADSKIAVSKFERKPGRASLLRRPRNEKKPAEPAAKSQPEEVQVVGIGPLGHIYLPAPLAEQQLHEACRALVHQGQIPLVVLLEKDETLRAWTSAGEYRLPADERVIFGDDHPFLEHLTDDLIRVCNHPESGDILFAGWRKGVKPCTFVYENGAHGAMSIDETRAFALLPAGTLIPSASPDFFRPSEFRAAMNHALGREIRPDKSNRRKSARKTLRVMTYNVHSCVGMDGRLSIRRIARVLAQCDADVIALQELDTNRKRTSFADQAHLLAEQLDMQAYFHPAISIAEEAYGDAILSRLPMRLVRAATLPGHQLSPGSEPRGAIWVEIDSEIGPIQIINTHLGLRPAERREQIDALLGKEWLGHADCREPRILCGDLNAGPRSPIYRAVAAKLRDVQHSLNGDGPKGTWLSTYPLLRIDHLFVSEQLKVASVSVPATHYIRQASDHLPLVVDLELAT